MDLNSNDRLDLLEMEVQRMRQELDRRQEEVASCPTLTPVLVRNWLRYSHKAPKKVVLRSWLRLHQALRDMCLAADDVALNPDNVHSRARMRDAVCRARREI